MIIDKYELSTKLRMLKPVIPKSKDTGLIAGVLVEDGWLKASNAITKIEIKLDTECDETFVIPYIALDLIDSLPSGNIEIKTTDKLVIIKTSKGGTYKYAKISTENTFMLEAKNTEHVLTMNADDFKSLVGKGTFPSSEKNKAPYNGILFRSRDEGIDIVACDGFNMTWNRLKVEADVDMVVHIDTIRRILAIDFEGEIEISNNAKAVVIKDDKVVLTSILCDGDFIKYTQVFPTSQRNTICVSREELLNSCKRAEKVRDIKTTYLAISKRNDHEIALELVSSTTTFEEILEYEGTLADNFKIGANPQYLIESVSAIDGEKITIGFEDDVKPICFGEDEYKSLTLPVRLKKAGAAK